MRGFGISSQRGGGGGEQDWALQASDLEVGPWQAAPPLVAWVAMAREEVFVPPPQETEQELQAVHSPQTQLPGQAWGLQTSEVIVSPVQEAPPLLAGTRTDLVADLRPPPQLALQALHWLQSFHTQFTGVAQA